MKSVQSGLRVGLILAGAAFFAAGGDALIAYAQPAESPTPGRKRRPPPSETPPANPPATEPAETPETEPATAPAPPAPTAPTPAKPATPGKPAAPNKTKKPGAATPKKPVVPAATGLKLVAKEIVEPGPYMVRTDPREWTFKTQVNVEAYEWEETMTDPISGKSVQIPKKDVFRFENLWVVFPIIPQTASSVTMEDGWSGTMRIENRVIADQVQVIPGLTSGTRLGKLTATNEDGRAINFQFNIKMTSFKVRLDEVKAAEVQWPKGDWPPVAKSTFEEQMYLDVYPDSAKGGSAPMNKDSLRNLVDGWLSEAGLRDPRDVSPLYLAKFLTGRVAENFQPAGDGIGTSRNGLMEGVMLQPIPVTIQRGRGSEFDIVNLLVAVFRQAGLPARIVVAQEAGSQDDGFLEASRSGKLRAWAEFCLFDENISDTRASVNWIPADVINLRKTSTRVPALEKPWRWFGTLEDSHLLAPFAFQFHPPTSVISHGNPAFWGWMMTPRSPRRANQAIKFEASATPKRSGEPNPATEKPGNYPPPATTNPVKPTKKP